MKTFRQFYAALAALRICQAASPTEPEVPPIGDAIGRVVCDSKVLTACQGEFCTVTFDTGDDTKFTFDFKQATYINPNLGPQPRAMQHLELSQAKGTYSAKFGIKLPGGPANVEFLANQPDDKTFKMTAAKRFVYPPKGDRPPIVVIEGWKCRKMAN